MNPSNYFVPGGNPRSTALKELGTKLERFSDDISLEIRRGWVEEMKNYVHLTDLNMEVLASVLVLMEKLPYDEENQLGIVIEFLSNVNHNVRTLERNDDPDQELYNEIASPLLDQAYKENLSLDEINIISIKMKATIFRYATKLFLIRNPESQA